VFSIPSVPTRWRNRTNRCWGAEPRLPVSSTGGRTPANRTKCRRPKEFPPCKPPLAGIFIPFQGLELPTGAKMAEGSHIVKERRPRRAPEG